MEHRLLNLIPFTSQINSDAVYRMISDIGYRVKIVKSDNWLSSIALQPTNLSVLLLDKDIFLQDKLRTALTKGNRSPTFAIIGDQKINENVKLLELCDDFTTWPCYAQELTCRLERLASLEGKSWNSPADCGKVQEEFISLNLLGQSNKFVQSLNLIKKVAHCDVSVFIEGETGTGKEVTARAIHYLSARQNHPFVPVNCGAIPDNLLENELFGHEKGAFTDAKEYQPGLIAQADGGTLFLDEIDSMSPKAQVALLRFLQDQEYRPLGAKKYKQADVRIITATNSNIRTLVEQGAFREDLYFRINIMSITLPPLRERGGDIRILAEHFLQLCREHYHQPDKFLHKNALRWLENYSWPGNVRELENTIHRMFLLAEGAAIHTIHTVNVGNGHTERRKNLPDRRNKLLFTMGFNEAKNNMIKEFEKNYLSGLMAESLGNVSKAAKIAGKERRALGKLLKKHQIKS